MLYLCIHTRPGFRGDEWEGNWPPEKHISLIEAPSIAVAQRKMARKCEGKPEWVQASKVDGDPIELKV